MPSVPYTGLPAVGQRVRFISEREIAGMGGIPEDAIGVVTEIEHGVISVRMEDDFGDLLREWDNDVYFEINEDPGFWFWVEAVSVVGADWYCNTCAHVFAAATDPDACPECGATDVVPDEDEDEDEDAPAQTLAEAVAREALFVTPANEAEAVAWVATATRYMGGGFHPDTDPGEYEEADGTPTFNATEADSFENALNRSHYLLDDIYAVALDALKV